MRQLELLKNNWKKALTKMVFCFGVSATVAGAVNPTPEKLFLSIFVNSFYSISCEEKPPRKKRRLFLQEQASFDYQRGIFEAQERLYLALRSQVDLDIQSVKNMQEEIEQQRQQVRDAELSLEAHEQRLRQAAEAHAQQYALSLIKPEEEKLNQAKHSLIARSESLDLRQQEIEECIAIEAQKWENIFFDLRQQYQEKLDTVETEFSKKMSQVANDYATIYHELIKKLNVEIQELKQPKLPDVESFTKYSTACLLAERILNFTYNQQKYFDFTDAYQDDTGSLAILIHPKKGVSNFLDDVMFIKKQTPAIQALATACNVEPEIDIFEGGIRFDFDVSGRTKQQAEARNKVNVIEEHLTTLKEIIENSFSFRLNGNTGSGKSNFANNLIGCMKEMYPKLELVLIDPKYPMSDWSGIEPKYKKIDGAILGLKAMADEVNRRLDLACSYADKKEPIPEFEPILYVVDEIDRVSAAYDNPTPKVLEYLQSLELSSKKACAALLKEGLKVGRALRVLICYVGQSPLCTDIGLRKNDFTHSCSFFLGENILAGIDDVALKHQQPYLHNQYRLRQKRYEESLKNPKIDEATRNSYKFFCLCKMPGRAPFLMTLPPPNSYEAKLIEITPEMRAGMGSVATVTKSVAWAVDASPQALVDENRQAIMRCISEGITSVPSIVKSIWGEVNFNQKPYKGKGGVKELIEKILKK